MFVSGVEVVTKSRRRNDHTEVIRDLVRIAQLCRGDVC